jgi:pyruvate/2-oxoglutarate dehydrogenase complex dihydrolipoamide dehydrogenase (E3) component
LADYVVVGGGRGGVPIVEEALMMKMPVVLAQRR